MPVGGYPDSLGSELVILEPDSNGNFWPVATRWRAVTVESGSYHAPEETLASAKAVPLSSRTERALLQAAVHDRGRDVLEAASRPGEHNTSASVIAALRLAGEYPERSCRFLEWLKSSPTDPSQLRFLRRYLPNLHVLVNVIPGLAAVMPLGTTALAILHAELLRGNGSLLAAEAALTAAPDGPARALAAAALRLDSGNVTGSLSFSRDRPVVDGATAALAVVSARGLLASGEPIQAMAALEPVVSMDRLATPVRNLATAVRAASQRALGLDVEAELTESALRGAPDTTIVLPKVTEHAPKVTTPEPPAPAPGLVGQQAAQALDAAWKRIQRRHRQGPPAAPRSAEETDAVVNEIIELIRTEQFEPAEVSLLGHMDQADDAVDRGDPVDDTFYILLAGMFAQRELAAAEITSLERLRSAHQRAGSEMPEEAAARLLEVRGKLDQLRP